MGKLFILTMRVDCMQSLSADRRQSGPPRAARGPPRPQRGAGVRQEAHLAVAIVPHGAKNDHLAGSYVPFRKTRARARRTARGLRRLRARVPRAPPPDLFACSDPSPRGSAEGEQGGQLLGASRIPTGLPAKIPRRVALTGEVQKLTAAQRGTAAAASPVHSPAASSSVS